jgi:hypothetical protein
MYAKIHLSLVAVALVAGAAVQGCSASPQSSNEAASQPTLGSDLSAQAAQASPAVTAVTRAVPVAFGVVPKNPTGLIRNVALVGSQAVTADNTPVGTGFQSTGRPSK